MREGRIHRHIVYRAGGLQKRKANPSKPTNQSRRRLTGKCGTARCHGCHKDPVSKSILKCKGSYKALSLSYIGPDWGLRRPHLMQLTRQHHHLHDVRGPCHSTDCDDTVDCDDEYNIHCDDYIDRGDVRAAVSHDGRRHAICSPTFDLIILTPLQLACLASARPPAPPDINIDALIGDDSAESDWCLVCPPDYGELDSLDSISSATVTDDDGDDDWDLC